MSRHDVLFLLLLGIALLALVLGAAGCLNREDAGVEPGDSTEPHVGMAVFQANCAECHGVAGEGHADWQNRNPDGTLRPPPLNGDGHTWHHADGILYRIVDQGGAIPSQPDFKSGMPAFGEKLSDQEIIDVLLYIKTLWHGKVYSDVSIEDLQARRSIADPFPAAAS